MEGWLGRGLGTVCLDFLASGVWTFGPRRRSVHGGEAETDSVHRARFDDGFVNENPPRPLDGGT